MNLHLTDREKQVMCIALEELRKTKQESAIGLQKHVQLNDFDILADSHVLMHTISLLSKLTGQPINTFANPQQRTKDKDQRRIDESVMPTEEAGPNMKWQHHPKMGWVRVPEPQPTVAPLQPESGGPPSEGSQV